MVVRFVITQRCLATGVIGSWYSPGRWCLPKEEYIWFNRRHFRAYLTGMQDSSMGGLLFLICSCGERMSFSYFHKGNKKSSSYQEAAVNISEASSITFTSSFLILGFWETCFLTLEQGCWLKSGAPSSLALRDWWRTGYDFPSFNGPDSEQWVLFCSLLPPPSLCNITFDREQAGKGAEMRTN